jgi:hypothetical protein
MVVVRSLMSRSVAPARVEFVVQGTACGLRNCLMRVFFRLTENVSFGSSAGSLVMSA